MIVNVYNNNIEKDQIETFKKLNNMMETFGDLSNFSIIMGGTGTLFWIKIWMLMGGTLNSN